MVRSSMVGGIGRHGWRSWKEFDHMNLLCYNKKYAERIFSGLYNRVLEAKDELEKGTGAGN